jgi:nitrogen fixation protein NifU and related proteins
MSKSTHELYKEIILEHYRSPRNSGRLENPDITAEAHNPLCGDGLELTIVLDGDRIEAVKVEVQGCSISQASASMMTEAIQGQTLADAAAFGSIFQAMMRDERNTPLPAPLQELQVFEVAKRYRSRIRCTLLAWEALLDGIKRDA